jgi:hypothetical protein
MNIKKRMMSNIKEINKINRDFYTYEINHKYFIIDETTQINKRISEKAYHNLLFENFAPD